MSITHEEARRLIQFQSDIGLEVKHETELSEHLVNCESCRAYLQEFRNIESILQKTMRKQWDARPLPLSTDVLINKVNSAGRASAILTTRMALVSVTFMLFAFIAWQSASTNILSTTSQTPFNAIPAIPTPTLQHIATNTLQNGCGEIRYIIVQNDTLDDIAQRFSVSKETIMLANQLDDEKLEPERELVIPLCESTPTSTTHPPTFTTTPIIDTVSTTPG